MCVYMCMCVRACVRARLCVGVCAFLSCTDDAITFSNVTALHHKERL